MHRYRRRCASLSGRTSRSCSSDSRRNRPVYPSAPRPLILDFRAFPVPHLHLLLQLFVEHSFPENRFEAPRNDAPAPCADVIVDVRDSDIGVRIAFAKNSLCADVELRHYERCGCDFRLLVLQCLLKTSSWHSSENRLCVRVGCTSSEEIPDVSSNRGAVESDLRS